MEDLVLGNSCDDGSGTSRNPLTQFVNHMLRDKSQHEHEEFRQQKPRQELNSRHEPLLHTQSLMPKSPIQGNVENFLQGLNPERMNGLVDPLSTFGEEDLEEFHEFMRNDPNGISPQIPPELLKNYIFSFINASKSHQLFRPTDIPELASLDSLDKQKISKRSHNLAQQLMSNQSQSAINSHVDSFLKSFGPQNFNPRFDPNLMAKEFSQMNIHSKEEEEFEHYYNLSNSQNMVDEFHFERTFEQGMETKRWVDEFEGKRPIQSVKSHDEELKEISRTINQQIQDPKFQSSKFSQFLSGISDGKFVVKDNELLEKSQSEVWANEFEKFDPSSNSFNWEKEFESSEENWVQEFDDFQYPSDFHQWLSEFGGPKQYVFADPSTNPYVGHPNPFQKGKELFNDGRLTQAILAFEAELLKNPDNSQCWHQLGQAHAENDKDEEAILALQKAVESDPSNLAAKMALAVSYTNDLTKEKALDVLLDWIQKNGKYNHLAIEPPQGLDFASYHNLVTDLFIQAARLNPSQPDSDVQTGLGLLYNLSQDFDKAIDCFKAALSITSEDYLLWNKLGATLANSGQSTEALGCYFNALSIKPSYVRARSNLGISYMALKEYDKAATCFLGALSMHPNATHMWHNLQMIISLMGRDDLTMYCINQELDKFREHFQF